MLDLQAHSRLADILGENLKSIFDLPAMYEELSVAAGIRMKEDFSKYGLELVDFFISAVTPPEEVQKMIDQRSAMGAIGDMGRFAPFKTRSIGTDGDSDGAASVAVGMGIDNGFGAFPAKNRNAAGQAEAAAKLSLKCPACGYSLSPEMKFCPGCGRKTGQILAARCRQCDTDLAPGAFFCGRCGAKVVTG